MRAPTKHFALWLATQEQSYDEAKQLSAFIRRERPGHWTWAVIRGRSLVEVMRGTCKSAKLARAACRRVAAKVGT